MANFDGNSEVFSEEGCHFVNYLGWKSENKSPTGAGLIISRVGQPSIAFNTSPPIALRLGSAEVLELCPILTQERIKPDQI